MRGGADAFLEKTLPDPVTGAQEEQHTQFQVYTEMLLNICIEYPGLPDPRTLSMDEIRFFYNGIRSRLRGGSK